MIHSVIPVQVPRSVIPAKAGTQGALTRTFLTRGVLSGCLLAAGSPAFAAGGHHAVDDAAILEPGQCELEGWFTRARGERVFHAGAGCRVGPVELGVAGEHARTRGAGSETAWGLQAKWAQEAAKGFSVGLALSPVWAAHARPRYQGATLAGLATWAAHENVALHLNLGRDFVHRGDDENRYGVAAEWTGISGWSLVAERYKESQTHFVRVGARWAAGENWSVDLSRAHRLTGPGVSNWTLGATWLLERK